MGVLFLHKKSEGNFLYNFMDLVIILCIYFIILFMYIFYYKFNMYSIYIACQPCAVDFGRTKIGKTFISPVVYNTRKYTTYIGN